MTDVVKGTLQQQTLVYEWKIERFFADCKSVGDSYTSPFFFANHPDKKPTKWYIRIYPKGLNEDKKDYISIKLNYAVANSPELSVGFQFSVANKQDILFTTEKVTSGFKVPSLGFGSGVGVDVEQLIIKDIINGNLIDDTLTIMCEIMFKQTDQGVTEKLYLTKIGKRHDDYEELFESASFADVKFNVQGNEIHLHKAILSHRCPYFKAMFDNEMKEKTQSSVDITHFNYPVMKELFRFIYAERVKEIENIAKDLLIAADYYSIVELKGLCENFLYYKLEVHNAVEYLKLTEMYNPIYLRSLAVDFTAKHYKQIKKVSEFQVLSVETLCRILDAMTENDN